MYHRETQLASVRALGYPLALVLVADEVADAAHAKD
jgi:hypothetical protein